MMVVVMRTRCLISILLLMPIIAFLSCKVGDEKQDETLPILRNLLIAEPDSAVKADVMKSLDELRDIRSMNAISNM